MPRRVATAWHKGLDRVDTRRFRVASCLSALPIAALRIYHQHKSQTRQAYLDLSGQGILPQDLGLV